MIIFAAIICSTVAVVVVVVNIIQRALDRTNTPGSARIDSILMYSRIGEGLSEWIHLYWRNNQRGVIGIGIRVGIGVGIAVIFRCTIDTIGN